MNGTIISDRLSHLERLEAEAHPDLPKVEDRIGQPLSPYAVTKKM